MKARESGKALRWEERLGFRKGQRANVLRELREWERKTASVAKSWLFGGCQERGASHFSESQRGKRKENVLARNE